MKSKGQMLVKQKEKKKKLLLINSIIQVYKFYTNGTFLR